MSLTRAKDHLAKFGLAERVRLFDVSSATVDLAAQALGVEGARIAKTLSFMGTEGPVLIVMAGDARLDNSKFKAFFRTKAKMLAHDDVEALIGHAVGGVCPFGVNEGVKVYLDVSLKRFETVYPACGTDNSAIALTLPELEQASSGTWIDVGKDYE